MTQTELANKLNKSLRTIQKYEANETKPPINVIRQISDIFFIDMNKLTDIEDDIYEELMAEYIDQRLSKMSTDDILTLKNQQLYENELENKEFLCDKLEPKYLELLYLSKIQQLEEIIKSKNNEIKLMEKINDIQSQLVAQFLNGENIDDILDKKAEERMYSILNLKYENNKDIIDEIINHKAEIRAKELFSIQNRIKKM